MTRATGSLILFILFLVFVLFSIVTPGPLKRSGVDFCTILFVPCAKD